MSSFEGLTVKKFGGTSVDSPQKIRAIAQKLQKEAKQGIPLVVVVSAMGHTTDELIELAHKVSLSPPNREMDMLLSVGERITMSLLSMALTELGVPAVSLTGSQSGIVTDQRHSRARIKRILGDRIRDGLNQNKVVIVAGFQGVSEIKEITTLGRGGSDTTAVALAIELKAKKCEIFTDVPGIMTADPRVVPNAKLLSVVSYDFIIALTSRGAQVMHPRSMKLAKKYGLDVVISKSDSNQSGTLVTSQENRLKGSKMEHQKITAITGDEKQCLIKLELSRASVLGAVWEDAHLNSRAIREPFFKGTTLWAFIERPQIEGWKTSLQKLASDGFVKEYIFYEDQVPLSIVGECFTEEMGVLNQTLEILSSERIPVEMAIGSENALTVSVPNSRLLDGVNALHKSLVSP